MSVFIPFLLLATAANSLGQIFNGSTCPKIPAQSNFKISEYDGSWIEEYRAPDISGIDRCIRTKYSLDKAGGIQVENTLLYDGKGIRTSKGVATVPDPDQPGVLSLKFDDIPVAFEHRIIETDYLTYSLVTSCASHWIFHLKYAQILTRGPFLPDEVIEHLKDVLVSNDFVDVSMSDLKDLTRCMEKPNPIHITE